MNLHHVFRLNDFAALYQWKSFLADGTLDATLPVESNVGTSSANQIQANLENNVGENIYQCENYSIPFQELATCTKIMKVGV